LSLQEFHIVPDAGEKSLFRLEIEVNNRSGLAFLFRFLCVLLLHSDEVLVFECGRRLGLSFFFPVNQATLQIKHRKQLSRIFELGRVFHEHNMHLFDQVGVDGEDAEYLGKQRVGI
jgi:hypothetical protein